MVLTKRHLAELMVFDLYSERFNRACAGSTSEVMNKLISEGLMRLERDSDNSPLFYLSITDEGKQALEDIGHAVLVLTVLETGKPHLLQHYLSKLALEDLPILLASGNDLARAHALKKYEELSRTN